MRWRSIFSHYWPFVVRYKWRHVVVLFFYGLGKMIDTALIPLIFKLIIDTVSNPPSDPSAPLGMAIIYLIIAFVITNIAFRIGDYFMITTQSKTLEHLTNYSLERLQRHSNTFFSNTFSGSLIAKSKRFVGAFETIHDQFVFSLWFGVVGLSTSLGVLLWFSPVLAFVFFTWLVLYIVMVYFLVKAQIPKSLENAAADTKVTSHYSDIITNFFTVKMFGAGALEEKAFARTANEQEKKRRSAWMQEGFWSSMWQSINITGFSVIFIGIAVWLWLEGSISAGTIVLMQIYIISSFYVVWNISKNIVRVSAALTDADEMVELFDQEIDVKDPKHPERPQMPHGAIEFRDVTFMYEGNENVFSDLNLTISAGEKVALVGHSGAGKSTITKLLLRFHDIAKGQITIDGQDITSVTQDALRKKIAYVPQEPVLFHRTLKENISYARPSASAKEVESVAKKAHAHEFISKLPKRYQTLVGERGVKLSGGERQRVAIARAMLKDAPIIVLDEATSALDSISENKIQDALLKLIEGKTTIVIAHRLSTIQKMDRIIVFDAGKIVEEGTHADLIAKDGVYAELWQSQVGGFIGD